MKPDESSTRSPCCCCPTKIYEGVRLEAVNKALAIAAYQHVSNERWGLGSPSLNDLGTEVARFRRLKHTIRPTLSKSRKSSPSRKAMSSMSSSSSPASSHDDRQTLEWRARFTLVEPHPGLYRYRVTDDWSNSEALIRATPRLHRVVADAVVDGFTSIFGRGEASPRDEGPVSGKGDVPRLDFKSRRLLRQASSWSS